MSEQRFRALADNMAQFAWMAYPSGYTFWHNQRWHDYTGVDAVGAAGSGWQQVIHPDYAERVVRQLTLALKNGGDVAGHFSDPQCGRRISLVSVARHAAQE